MTENRFNHTQEEEIIGNEFANLFGLSYHRNNGNRITDIDGLINGREIELQELKYERSLRNKNAIIDVVSVFYFNTGVPTRKTIKMTDTDIDIRKKGKIYTLPDESLYLIFIKKSTLEKYGITEYLPGLIESENLIFLPLNVKKLKEDFDEAKVNIIVNNKKTLSDTWQSAFSIINPEKYLYTREELNDFLF